MHPLTGREIERGPRLEPASVAPPPGSAPVLEVFASIQGEGAYVGELHSFVRLRGCPLRCRYCDTPHSWSLEEARAPRVVGASEPAAADAWSTPFQVACWLATVEDGRPRTVSITGGEPLLWPEFVLGLRSLLGTRRLHLETAGAHPAALARVIDAVDHVSLDLKAEADLAAPVEFDRAFGHERAPRTSAEWRATRRAALALVAGRDAAAKIVVCGGTAQAEYTALLAEARELAPQILVVVQPATPVGDVRAPRMEEVLAVAERARELELAVRVLPQVHKFLRVR